MRLRLICTDCGKPSRAYRKSVAEPRCTACIAGRHRTMEADRMQAKRAASPELRAQDRDRIRALRANRKAQGLTQAGKPHRIHSAGQIAP